MLVRTIVKTCVSMEKNVVKVSDLEPCNSVNVEGVFVGTLSPVRKNKQNKYYDGSFSDGVKTVTFVSFEPKLREEIEEAHKNCYGVSLLNCAVKCSRQDESELEVFVSSKTSVLKSPKKFKIDKESTFTKHSKVCTLEDVSEHQRVTVKGKVVEVSAVEKITVKSTGKNFTKRDFVLANLTSQRRCVAWEQHVDDVQEDKSYKLMNVIVRSFNGSKYISVGQESEVVTIEDIGEVIDNSTIEDSGCAKVCKGEIIGITSVETYRGCINCSAKVVEMSGILADCNKCSTKMKIKYVSAAKCC